MDPNPLADRRADRRTRGTGRPVRTGAVFLAAASLAAVLAGCAPGGDRATPETSVPPATTPVPQPETSPTAMPPASDAPVAPDADHPLTALDAYALCRAQTFAYYPGDFALLEYAPFADATVLQRTDGLWFAYIEVDDGNRPADQVDVGASNCIVGGTLAEPSWERFGVVSRDLADDVIDGYDDPLGSA
ncbi:hypothetical protein GCM10009819_20110 [Agromyces tropicus]|uniref:Lipoprotein n=1 Tax=Agromyces tropicus TaxID=555371 RepID=A0ABP5FYK7_9MICO